MLNLKLGYKQRWVWHITRHLFSKYELTGWKNKLRPCLYWEKRVNICGRRCCIYFLITPLQSPVKAVCVPKASLTDWKQKRIIWHTTRKERSLNLGSKVMEIRVHGGDCFGAARTLIKPKKINKNMSKETFFGYLFLFLGLFHKLYLGTLLQGLYFTLLALWISEELQ